ncbi:MAG: MBL fold metallo-hydrolase [Acholeplasmatales bacterium]|nr:MBL fold metallo-hydrolase [Acholeplasmatales bacterium]
MYDLHHLKGNTYYIDGPTNCGVYVLNDKNEVLLFDCGTEDDAPHIYETLKNNGMTITHLVFSHCHSDHSQGCHFIHQMTNCKMFASKVERGFFRDPKLDIGFLYGGYPLDEYDGKLMHVDMNDEIYAMDQIPEGVEWFHLPGHHWGMIGIKTSDDVYFVADTLGSIDLVERAHILLIYDVKGYLESLNFVESLDGKLVVPSHSQATNNIKPVVEFNRNQIYKIIDILLDYLKEEHNCTECCSYVFDYFKLRITYNKYMLILSTVRSYLSYLSNSKKIKNYFKDNRLVFINENK